MKKVLWLFMAMLLIMPLCAMVVMAQDDAEVEVIAEKITEEEAVAEKEESGQSVGQIILSFLNSPLGVTVVVSLMSLIFGKLVTAKPKWKGLILKYGPLFMQAVKMAEKNIPDDTGSSSLARLDAALQYVKELDPHLKAACESDVKLAISAVHSSAEANGNLKKSE